MYNNGDTTTQQQCYFNLPSINSSPSKSVIFGGIVVSLFFFSSILFFCYFRFSSVMECVCRACRIQYDDMAVIVVSVWRSVVHRRTCTIYSRIENRQGHWLC